MNIPLSALLTIIVVCPFLFAQDSGPVVEGKVLKKGVYERITGLQKAHSSIETGCDIFYYPFPLKGRYNRAAFDSAAGKMVPFLARHGKVTAVSFKTLSICLYGVGDSSGGARYIVLPLEVRTKAAEKKIEVQSFVNLDKEGNFIPSDTRHTLSNITIEMRCRFVVVDLRENARVFDAWYYARAGSDDAMRDGRQPAGKNAGRSADDQSLRCVLYIIDKVKRHLARKFG
jgi:hypothetical protein